MDFSSTEDLQGSEIQREVQMASGGFAELWLRIILPNPK